MAKTDLTAARLRELLNYDPETGIFTRRVDVHGGRYKAGDVVGNINRGYVETSVDRQTYCAHRLAFLYMTGEWPKHYVDHRNLVRSDNRWANLREATPRLNQENKIKANAGNRSGYLGVTKQSTGHTFMAKIKSMGVERYLGNFKTAEEAHQAYLSAKRRLHEGCTI
jgi:hypothetical protein